MLSIFIHDHHKAPIANAIVTINGKQKNPLYQNGVYKITGEPYDTQLNIQVACPHYTPTQRYAFINTGASASLDITLLPLTELIVTQEKAEIIGTDPKSGFIIKLKNNILLTQNSKEAIHDLPVIRIALLEPFIKEQLAARSQRPAT